MLLKSADLSDMTAAIWGPYCKSTIKKPHAEDESIRIAKILYPVFPNKIVRGVLASIATWHDGANEDSNQETRKDEEESPSRAN